MTPVEYIYIFNVAVTCNGILDPSLVLKIYLIDF